MLGEGAGSSKVHWCPSHEHSTSEETGFVKPAGHNVRFIHCSVVHETCTEHHPCSTGIQQSVLACTKVCDGRSQKSLFSICFMNKESVILSTAIFDLVL